MKYILLNSKNKKHMKSELNSNFNFKWEDSSLIKDLIKKIEHIYPSSSATEDFQKDEESLKTINSLFDELFERKISNEDFLKNLKREFKQIKEKYPDLNNDYRYRFDNYSTIINNSHRLLINGYAGIGKSYFVYKLEEELTKINIHHLCVYGKYSKNIPLDVFKEIENIKEEFYLVIDALNEFDELEQISIIKQIKKLSRLDNMNIIVTYRNNTIRKNVLDDIQKIIKNEYEFKGVDFESSLLMMIEAYGIETIKYLDVIETNNPLYIIMLNKILKSHKLKDDGINSIVQITYIMEYYIKKQCGKVNWKIIKNIGKLMLDHERNYITEDELKMISGKEYNNFVDKVIENDFMYESNFESSKAYWFSIHELSDYIIARPLFDIITDMTENEIIKLINNKTNKLYSISEAISILIFEKYKDKDLKKAIRIFFKSNLHSNTGLEFIKKINFSNKQIEIIQDSFKVGNIAHVYCVLGGLPDRPFNCINYINKLLFKNNSYELNIIERFREPSYLIHLKNIIYSIPFLTNEKNIIYEYFYYSFWLMSSTNERIRNMATKIVYDLTFMNKQLKKDLITNYIKVSDYYIKNSIIHILTMLPKDRNSIYFLKKIYKSKKELDAESIYRIARYFNIEKNIPNIHKKNLYKKLPLKIVVDKKLDLNRIIFLADIYEKYLLQFERYPKEENTISINENFIINNSKKIKKYNKKLNKMFNCIKDDGYCKYSIGGKELQDKMYKINIKPIDNKKCFLVFQEIFKEVSKKYNYDYYKEEQFDFHLNRFENSLLKKILLISQNILLGSLMTNYYTEEFSVFNDDVTLGYKPFSYIKYDEEKIYLAAPISPYNELIDKLNDIKCKEIGLYDNRNYKWYKDVKLSKNICSKLTKKIKYNGEYWSLIGGSIHQYINGEVNESYSCYMGINPDKYLDDTDNCRLLTIENKDYYGNIEDYNKLDCDKNMNIYNFQSNSEDIKESGLSFPSPRLIRMLNLHYDTKYSSWNDKDENIIILCDNNPKKYFVYPVSGAIYIKTSILNKLKKNNTIVYWCYTEKLFEKYGWNEEASLHIQLNCNGEIEKIFKNNDLNFEDRQIKETCKNCKYGIYQKKDRKDYSFQLDKLEEILKK